MDFLCFTNGYASVHILVKIMTRERCSFGAFSVMDRKQKPQINSCFRVIFRELTVSIPPFQMRFSYDSCPARYLSTLLSQILSESNSRILPSTGLSVLHLEKFDLTTGLNPSLYNPSQFFLILAINPSQIQRINHCFLFALFITCLKIIIYQIYSLQVPKSLH